MLSSVLNSERAIKVSILIIDTFIKLREMLSSQKEIMLKLDEMEKKIEGHDEGIRTLFEALKQLLSQPIKRIPKIGFKDHNPTSEDSYVVQTTLTYDVRYL